MRDAQDAVRFYSDCPDEERLSGGWGQLAFARSQELVLRYLGSGRRTVLDVGGGTGVCPIGCPGSGRRSATLAISRGPTLPPTRCCSSARCTT